MVECQICKKRMNWIQNTHLKKHNITLEEYKRRYPNHPTKSEKMTQVLKDTRWGDYKPKTHKCAHPECDNQIHYKNKYCSHSCRGKIAYKDSLKDYATPTGNPGYKDGVYRHSREQKKLAFQRDNCTCQRCDKHLDGISEKYGIHHLIPRRTFDNHEDADVLENLVTLCSKCHKDVETELVVHLVNLYRDPNRLSDKDLMKYLRSKV